MSRESVIEKLNQAGIGNSIFYPLPIHQQPYYKELGYNESHIVAEKITKEVISLPVHPSVTPEDLEAIAKTIKGLKNA